jgi:hypothetical protein
LGFIRKYCVKAMNEDDDGFLNVKNKFLRIIEERVLSLETLCRTARLKPLQNY